MEERLQKILSAAGVCSRRAAEGYITTGRVTVNGHPAFLGQRADPDRDEILVDGRPLDGSAEKCYLMLNKPRGFVTTLSDEKGRRTTADLVRDCGVRVWPVGRLDLDSEGLLLMTNDGELTHRLLHPSGEVEKVYQVDLFGPVAGAAARLEALRDLDGEPIRPAQAAVLRQAGQRAVMEITIHEGKNRQVRRMCGACGLTVKRLRRVREHTLELGDLPAGQWRYLTTEETAALRGVL
ncbi:MAG: rRNA pseudouridine synthase [Oscillibacter sp.]|nr:rRNA pseudouridine synthase [Oscillibacter sp.]